MLEILVLAAALTQYTPNSPGVVSRPVEQSGGNPQPGIGPGWNLMVPLKKDYYNPQLGKLLSDIESMMPQQHIYRDNDLVTWAHETTHGVNSRARQALPERHNAFYCFNKRAFVLPEPNVTKEQLKHFIPRNIVGDAYGLYVDCPPLPPSSNGIVYETQNKIPLHILDEWTAYLNGLDVSVELRLRNSADSDLGHAVELAGYASALLRCIDKFDPHYRYRPEYIYYCNYCLDRTGGYLRSTPKQQIMSHAQLIKRTFGGQQNVDANVNPIVSGGNFVGR